MALVDWLERLPKARKVWFEIKNEKPTSTGFHRGEMLRAAIIQNGWRVHELMNEVKPGDCIVHVDTIPAGRSIIGMSIVNGNCKHRGGRYQIPLRDFEPIELSLDNFIGNNKRKLRGIIDETNPSKFPFRRQGKDSVAIAENYFREASSELVKLIVGELGGTASNGDTGSENHPGKRERLIEVYARDQTLVNELKQLYKGRCQLCGSEPFDGRFGDLLEGHHIDWLSRGGPDTRDNLVLLCPSHHAAIHAADRVLFDLDRLVFEFQYEPPSPISLAMTTNYSVPVRLDLHLKAQQKKEPYARAANG